MQESRKLRYDRLAEAMAGIHGSIEFGDYAVIEAWRMRKANWLRRVRATRILRARGAEMGCEEASEMVETMHEEEAQIRTWLQDRDYFLDDPVARESFFAGRNWQQEMIEKTNPELSYEGAYRFVANTRRAEEDLAHLQSSYDILLSEYNALRVAGGGPRPLYPTHYYDMVDLALRQQRERVEAEAVAKIPAPPMPPAERMDWRARLSRWLHRFADRLFYGP